MSASKSGSAAGRDTRALRSSYLRPVEQDASQLCWEPPIGLLLDSLPHQIVRLNRRRAFSQIDKSADDFIFVSSGAISISHVGPSGRPRILALRFPGECVLPARNSNQQEIHAVCESSVTIVKADDLTAALSAKSKTLQLLYRLVQRNEAISHVWLINCRKLDAKERVAHLLCELSCRTHANVLKQPLFNPLTQQQMGDITCQTAASVNRTLKVLEAEGLIRRSRRKVFVNDWCKLCRIAKFDPQYLREMV